MATLVGGPAYCGVRVQGVLVIFRVQLRGFALLVHFQDGLELDVPLVLAVQVRRQLAQLKLFVVHPHPLQHILQVVDADAPVAVLIQTCNCVTAEHYVLLAQSVFHHSSIFKNSPSSYQ